MWMVIGGAGGSYFAGVIDTVRHDTGACLLQKLAVLDDKVSHWLWHSQ